MASKGKAQNGLKAHEETYGGFIKLLSAGTIAAAAVGALVLVLIS